MLQNLRNFQINDIPQSKLSFWLNKLKISFAIIFILRLGLSLWIGIIWSIVDRYFPADQETINLLYGHFDVSESLFERVVLHAWVRWDAVHFLNIAKFTYSNLGQVEYNFFPLYPWLIRLFGLNGTFDLTLVALSISTISVFIALIIFDNLAYTVFQNEQLANWTIFTWAIFPTSFFLFAPYSDALYAVFSLGCLLALVKKQWIISGLLAFFAGLTRGQGILLVVPFVVQSIFYLYENKVLNFRAFIGMAIAPLGGLAYIIWRIQWAGMLFDGYAAYHKRTIVDPITAFVHAIRQAVTFDPWQASMDVLSILFFGLIVIYAFKIPIIRKEAALLSYTMVTFASFLPWYSEVISGYQSSTRYVLSLYPAFLVLAYLLNRYPRIQKYYILANLILLLLTSAGYTMWIFVG